MNSNIKEFRKPSLRPNPLHNEQKKDEHGRTRFPLKKKYIFLLVVLLAVPAYFFFSSSKLILLYHLQPSDSKMCH